MATKTFFLLLLLRRNLREREYELWEKNYKKRISTPEISEIYPIRDEDEEVKKLQDKRLSLCFFLILFLIM